MQMSKKGLYGLLIIACIAGYIWLYFGLTLKQPESVATGACLIKHITHIPCPSCGSTRSVISIIKGDFSGAFLLNPLGYLVALIMLIVPLWILFDLSTKKETLLKFYYRIEHKLKNPKYAIPLIIMVLANWIWNIKKGL